MSTTEAAEAAPLNDAMLMMDVVDTLRHSADLPLAADGRSLDAEATVGRLKASYRQAGSAEPVHVLASRADLKQEAGQQYLRTA